MSNEDELYQLHKEPNFVGFSHLKRQTSAILNRYHVIISQKYITIHIKLNAS